MNKSSRIALKGIFNLPNQEIPKTKVMYQL